jgi:hypothetical protein
MLYITANANVRLRIVNRKLKFQKPDLSETISQTDPIKYKRLIPINVTAPRYFEIKILKRERGFERSKSIVPLSTMEGINDADDIMQNISISRYETEVMIT